MKRQFKINIKQLIYIGLISGMIFIPSCTDVPQGVVVNEPPQTYLSIFPDSIISPQKTRLKISWWGDDPDGLIAEFRFSFDSTNWASTTKNDSTFQLIISGNDSTFRFWVAAVDDKGLADPTPATNLYPVINSPPSVSFNPGTELPDTSFPVASFKWTGTDPDGDNTIRHYYWALNDTSAWHTVSPNTTLLTLRQTDGIIPNANNRLYLKAEDIAGMFSSVKRMPDTNKTWFVRAKVGNILLINDYTRGSDLSQAVQFYQGALDSAFLNNYSKLDIKVGGGVNIPKITNPMFIETLKLFQCVIWFANRGIGPNDNANFDLAQLTLPFFVASGGKLLFSTGFPDAVSSQGNIINFAPVDSMTNFVITLLDPGVETLVFDNNYPVLQAGSAPPDRVRGIRYRAGTPVIYKLPYSTPYDTSKITVCIKDAIASPKVFFLSVPLNKMNGNGGATYFLRRVLGVDFGLN